MYPPLIIPTKLKNNTNEIRVIADIFDFYYLKRENKLNKIITNKLFDGKCIYINVGIYRFKPNNVVIRVCI